jgi:hypothetical protein
MNDVVEVLDQERDDRILKMRLVGASIRTIARENQCTIPEVNAVIDRLLDQIDNKYRMRTIAIELERLDHLHRAYFTKALQGDTAAGQLLIRIGERRAALLALDSPVRVDVISLQQEAAPTPTSDRPHRGGDQSPAQQAGRCGCRGNTHHIALGASYARFLRPAMSFMPGQADALLRPVSRPDRRAKKSLVGIDTRCRAETSPTVVHCPPALRLLHANPQSRVTKYDEGLMRQGIIFYARVSTNRQGKSGLGLSAQRKAVQIFADAEGFEIVGEYTEVETGKGRGCH